LLYFHIFLARLVDADLGVHVANSLPSSLSLSREMTCTVLTHLVTA
jgi:hypothetical protein